MKPFTTSQASIIEIQRILSESDYRDPVARLYERADVSQDFEEIRNSFAEKEQAPNDLVSLSKKRFSSIEERLVSSRLAIGACERSDFNSEDLYSVDGITFVMNPFFVEKLRNCQLMFEEGSFHIRDADNISRTLRSLASER
jgi:hypothetical protein